MAETTTNETRMTRDEAAVFLRSMADELSSDSARIGVPVGNKEIQLSPPGTVEVETTVLERSRRLRKDVEEVSVRFKWNPTGDTAESEPEPESESVPETETEPETKP